MEDAGLPSFHHGAAAELDGETIHAEICRAVLQNSARQDSPPHPQINMNDPKIGTALHWATSRRLREASVSLIASRHFRLVNARRGADGSTALHIAAAEGLTQAVEGLLHHPDFVSACGVDSDGFSALHGAAYRGHRACVHLLMSCPSFASAIGAVGEFDVVRPAGHWAAEARSEYDMCTSLQMAAYQGHAEICDDILTLAPLNTASANHANRVGATALHMAVRRGHVSACEAILRHTQFNAINQKDTRGFTALHLAAQHPSADMCALILARDDFMAIDTVDLRGRTAFELAKEEGHFEVCRLILAKAGKST